MRHIEKLEIEQFRGIRNLKLEGLGEVNLLVGGNNSGKTSVLEAIDLHCHPLDILRLVSISKKRDSASVQLPTLDSVRWMFPIESRGDTKGRIGDISISSGTEKQVSYSLISCIETTIIARKNEDKINRLKRNVELLQTVIEQGQLILEVFDDDEIRKQLEDRKQEVLGIEKEIHLLMSAIEEVRAFDVNFSHKITIDTKKSHEDSEICTLTNSYTIKRGEKSRETFSTEFITPIDHRSLPFNSEALSNTILAGEQSRIIELLSLFDENISGIQVLAPDGNVPAPFIEHKKLGFTPASIFGDGVRRALTLALGVLNAKNGILLLDEIETAVHVNALDKVFTWLVKACKQYNVQLFATTHSLEAIDSILSAFLESDEVKNNSAEWQDILQNFVTYRLVQKETETVAKRFAGPELADLRYDFGQDVR